jgi:hypothetical protein
LTGTEQIPAKLIQAGVEQFNPEIHKVIFFFSLEQGKNP